MFNQHTAYYCCLIFVMGCTLRLSELGLVVKPRTWRCTVAGLMCNASHSSFIVLCLVPLCSQFICFWLPRPIVDFFL